MSKSNQVQESVVPTTTATTATMPISRQKSADEGENCAGTSTPDATQSPLFSRQISGEDGAEMSSSSAASQLLPIARKSKPLLVSE